MAQRPGGVTLVAVIVWIQGLLTLIGGIIALIGAFAPGVVGGAFLAVAIISIVIGIITIAVGFGLLRGSNGARILTTVVLVISLATAIFSLFTTNSFWSQVVSALLAVIGLILLYTQRANEYFRE
ncbi:hypothetical protein [Herbiconiux ginsengi]|uniref:Uncharacterized protein n=1 Tax=Herbiconiux ginsengi TaxID=381665 RepID=A0A1H3NBE9_9MICO|nr:hypothetical protein [Herbiconiux ginsengi]SDY86083.1 hypothetical protein SAMN05216554_1774 [Herbiconiux ginsengi]